VTEVAHSSCPECGLSSFVSAEHHFHVCGYCGYGPWDPSGQEGS
jgi:ribosomal protein S27AE